MHFDGIVYINGRFLSMFFTGFLTCQTGRDFLFQLVFGHVALIPVFFN